MKTRSSDASLKVAAMRAGDHDAFEWMVRTYGPRLFAVALQLTKSREDAADCVQESMLSAYQGIDSFNEQAALGTWLHRIVVNAALTKLRRRKSRPERSIEELMPVFDERDCRIEPDRGKLVPVDELLMSKQVRRTVREAIDLLPASHRLVLLHRDIHELSTSETATLLDMSPGAVKVRLHRARCALKKLLEPVVRREDSGS